MAAWRRTWRSRCRCDESPLVSTSTTAKRALDTGPSNIGRTTGGQGFDTVSFATYADLRDRNTVFDGVYALREPQPLSLGGNDGADRVYAEQVSASYFDVLGLVPAAGGFFHTAEEQVGVPLRKVVLSDDFWQRRFKRDPSVVGQDLVLNGDTFTIAGVAPAGYHGTTVLAPDLWLPLTAYARAHCWGWTHWELAQGFGLLDSSTGKPDPDVMRALLGSR